MQRSCLSHLFEAHGTAFAVQAQMRGQFRLRMVPEFALFTLMIWQTTAHALLSCVVIVVVVVVVVVVIFALLISIRGLAAPLVLASDRAATLFPVSVWLLFIFVMTIHFC